jgi:hypothetical protein
MTVAHGTFADALGTVDDGQTVFGMFKRDVSLAFFAVERL